MCATRTICLHDRDKIEAFLRRRIFLNIYQLGDLDDYFWPHTTWYALTGNAEIKAIALIYSGLNVPTLLAMAGDDEELSLVEGLLSSIKHLLPRKFYSHLGVGLADTLSGEYCMDSHGKHLKMALTNTSRLDQFDTSDVVALPAANAGELLDFYTASYPGHGFEPSMLLDAEMQGLETGQYCGIRGDHGLICVAGVHVYSREYGVAALGNIATHPAYRRKGHAAMTIAALCKKLLKTVQHIGLNVKAENHAAIACYQKLGFETVGTYEEYNATPR